MKDFVQSKTVEIKFFFYNEVGAEKIKDGVGFVINNLYLVTAYHHLGQLSDSGFVFKNAFIYVPSETSGYKRLKATLDYEPEPGQYDFRNHVWNKLDYSTDIVVFKLESNFIGISEVNVDCKLTKKDSLFAIGYGYKSGEVNNPKNNLNYSSLSFVNYIFESEADKSQGKRKLMFIGTAMPGYSGSPLFNKDRELVGMIQEGWKDIGQLESTNSAGILSSDEYNSIKNRFFIDSRVGFAFDISYLIAKYLKGYL